MGRTPQRSEIIPKFTGRSEQARIAAAKTDISVLSGALNQFELDNVKREFYSMPWEAAGPDGDMRSYFIWGATAAMLRNLYRFLSAG